MSWIKIQNGLVSNRKTARLAREMKWSKMHTVGFLISFWVWAIENCEDGQLKDITDTEIAFGVGLDRLDGIIKSLTVAGLVDESPLRIHDWVEHQHDFLWGKYKDNTEKRLELLSGYSGVTPVLLRGKTERKKERKIDINTDTAAAAVVDDKKLVNWGNCKSDLQSLMAHYIQIEQPEIYKSGTQAQVNALFKRYGRAASELLAISGDLTTAKRVFDLSAAHYAKKGLSWNLSTVVANAGDFLNVAIGEKKNVCK